MLLGFAEETQFPFAPLHRRCALVYEMLHGGDLYRRLQRDDKPYLWHDRLRTATEVCRGLAHLHKHRPKIFHRDIKSQNILFSTDGTAKIADFGLACMASHHHEHELATVQVAGTLGYSDPLYTRTGVISESSECYSFGQVLIELLVGRPPAVLAQDGHSCVRDAEEVRVFLSDELRPKEDAGPLRVCVGSPRAAHNTTVARRAVRATSTAQDKAKGRVLRRLDGRAQWPLQTAASMATLALLCIHDDADRRPSFLEATDMLRDLTATTRLDSAECADSERSRQSDSSHVPEDKSKTVVVDDEERDSGACSPVPLMQPKLLELRSADVLQRLLRQAQHPHFPKHLQVQSPNMPSPKVRFPHLQAPSMHTTDTHSPDVGPRPGMSPHSPEARQPAQGSSAPHQGLQHPPLHQRLQLWNQPTGPELAQPLHFSVDTRPKIQPQAWPRAHLLHAKSMPDASQAAQLCVHVGCLFQAEVVKDLMEQLQQWPGSTVVPQLHLRHLAVY
ncbi:Wall-associated receptor kinase-like 17 [Durusdinium trenchii]|uniref:Wall-associated receptor kinase-like 17 n=1 Tax=Durusdinium trenchii TaxID=1381693 RepID=A0ABP0LMS9_9DINO